MNPGPSDYKSDALPLSYEGCWMVPKLDTIDKSRKKQNQNNHDSASGNVVRNSDCPGATCYIPSVRKQFDTHSTLITEFPNHQPHCARKEILAHTLFAHTSSIPEAFTMAYFRGSHLDLSTMLLAPCSWRACRRTHIMAHAASLHNPTAP